MAGHSFIGLICVVAGAVLIVVGLLVMSGYSFSWIGRLPGDIHITRNNFSLYLPITTCVVISACVTIILKVLSRK